MTRGVNCALVPPRACFGLSAEMPKTIVQWLVISVAALGFVWLGISLWLQVAESGSASGPRLLAFFVLGLLVAAFIAASQSRRNKRHRGRRQSSSRF